LALIIDKLKDGASTFISLIARTHPYISSCCLDLVAFILSKMRGRLLPALVLLSIVDPVVRASLNITVTSPPINVTQTLESPFPYDFPNLDDAEIPALFPMPPCNGITLEEATIDQLQDYMSRGLLTSVQLALCYLQRHWQTDDYIK
jgi:hypothetical protein